ncbi:MAG: substrate-binding domain-containing protein [Actinobacteria bacterium]|nr:substrate-binding domain-containing protein [Actinomycetota bacterium]MCL5735838.1 substrate-binding domain-containing protein [Actinomycetota bacterium]
MIGRKSRVAPTGNQSAWLWALALMLVVALALGVVAVGCGGGEETTSTAVSATTLAPSTTAAPTSTSEASTSTSVAEKSDLILASTTSTQDSGLFDVLIPAFNKVYPQYTVKVVAVGSGEALKLGETGDADVLLVHSPAAEQTFMDDGFGVDRKAVMYNDFIIVGPPSDPAKIKGMTDAAAALTAIANAKALYYNRGDKSGTDAKEKTLWKAANITPSGDWYQVTGQGMGETLTIADQKGGYTLADRGTFLSKKGSLQLEILVEGDKALFNQYHVITCKNAKNVQGGNDFMNWIVSADAQQNIIAPFGKDKYGQGLFIPNAGQVE